MPKLSDLIRGTPPSAPLAPAVGAATAPRMKLSQVQAPASAPAPAPAQAPRPSLFRADSDFADMDRGGVGQINIGIAALKDMFGSRQGAAEYLAEQSGGSVVKGDDGEPMVRLGDGSTYRLNDPGIDTTDAANVAGNVAAFWTPAAWLNRFAKARNIGLAGRAGLQGAGAAVTDTALQAAADRGRVDPVRVAASGAGGLGGEVAGQVLGAATRKVAQLFRSGANSRDAAMKLATEAGIPAPSPEVLTRLSSGLDEIKAGADPRAILGREEFGFLYTQGQRLADTAPQKWGVLSREELLRQQPGSAEVFNAATRQNASRLDDALNTIGERQGAPAAATPAELAQGAATRLKGQADALDTRIGQAYDKAAEMNGAAISADSVRSLPTRLTQAVREFAPNATTTPATDKTLQQIRLATDTILKGADGANVSGVTLRALETQRRILNNNINAAGNNADRAAMIALKREFDGWLDGAVDSALVSGDPKALAAIKEARGLRAEFGRRFEGGADSDKFIAGLLDGSRTPEELVNIALGAGQVSKAGGARFIERLRVAADGDPEVIGALRSANFLRLTRGANGEPLQMGQIVRNIRTSEYNNASVVKALYSPQEWAEIRRLAGALEPMLAKGDLARTSGTAERAARMLAQRIGGGLPIIGDTVQGIFAGKNWVQANRALNAPVKLPTYSPPGAQPVFAGFADEYVTR